MLRRDSLEQASVFAVGSASPSYVSVIISAVRSESVNPDACAVTSVTTQSVQTSSTVSRCFIMAYSPQTSFARRNTAQPLGQPTYMVAWVMMAAISFRVTPWALAFCR